MCFCAVGPCGSRYKEPGELIWLNGLDALCSSEISCRYAVEAPTGSVIRLNFTSMSGKVGPGEGNGSSPVYDLIDGQSSCRPRIEVWSVPVAMASHSIMCEDERIDNEYKFLIS